MNESSLYFLAIMIPEPYSAAITRIKENIRDEYGCSHALKTVPHITLIAPFSSNDAAVKNWCESVSSKFQNHQALSFRLHDFDHFRKDVLFIRVKTDDEVLAFQRKLQAEYELFFNKKNLPYNEWHPHVTIAHRDMDETTFHDLWQKFRNRKYHAEFDTIECVLLKRAGQQWKPFLKCTFNTK